eukprot:NODE_774_length_4360_cov_0.289134.p4 type:complete len:127 gc:universal NODE_774_length_4360_cov_0.289134:1575-1955(+)
MADFISLASTIFWVGLSLFSVYYLDIISILMLSINYYSMQAALACYAVLIYQAVRVIFIIPRQSKVIQITPENYQKYAKKEIELACMSGVAGFLFLVVALWPHLHILTPFLLILYFLGLVNILKYF